IVERGVAGLVEMVVATARHLYFVGEVPVVAVGGLVESNREYRQHFAADLAAALPQARLREPLAPPVVGAVLSAFQQVGANPSHEALDRLTRSNGARSTTGVAGD